VVAITVAHGFQLSGAGMDSDYIKLRNHVVCLLKLNYGKSLDYVTVGRL